MTELAEIKPLCRIVLIGGKEFITSMNMETIQKALEYGSLLKIEGTLINPSSISYVEPFIPTEIESFIAGITDLQMKERLKAIVNGRKMENKRLETVQHLMQIYNDRFGEISDDKTNEG